MKTLLYIHNNSITHKGSLNTTLLQIFSMCNAFSRAGFKVVLAMEGNKTKFSKDLKIFVKSSFNDQINFKIINWEKRSSKRLLNRFLIIPQVKKHIRKINPDIIFTREAVFLRPILKLQVPLIFESHNAKQHKRFHLFHLFLLREIKRLSKKKDFLCLFSISNSLNEFWKENGVKDEKLFSWHDGFDADLFKSQIPKSNAKQELNLPRDKKIITYTGGLYKDREIENIILLAQNNSDNIFLIIGGPEKNKLYFENYAIRSKVKNIIFTGLVPHIDIPKYLYASDVLLALWSSSVPTINYCSPLKVFEYMAAGRTILAHDFPTIREVLGGLDAVVFCKPGNQVSLEKGLTKALSICVNMDSADVLRLEAFSTYTWDNRVQQLIQYLNLSIV